MSDARDKKVKGGVVLLSAFKSRIEHQFSDNEEFIINTKRMFKDELDQIEAMADGADEDTAELLFDDYRKKEKIFPEMFMTAWIITTFSYFEHWLDRLVIVVPDLLDMELGKWPKVQGKFNRAERHLQRDCSLKIQGDLFDKMAFYKRLRNQLAHAGRILSSKKTLVRELEAYNDIECRESHGSKVKIVVQKQFARTMNNDLRELLLAIVENSKQAIRG
ncbi:hypothetical protein [Pseudodesulfovibrio sediminis]|uniref:RiboL-PSP-HEPN domain-containing protein n=1 Tax=Pseudodesulfovibrio sediminis TaxID=2810563 RepID=A0ABN6EVP5_9BACT|nr:hypothetical protein [Pseudodesulfovibrio sediminis]BCS89552.1 hypothetical protein PSDVSF_27940 [Pseudodesulfovibrio sediminis]